MTIRVLTTSTAGTIAYATTPGSVKLPWSAVLGGGFEIVRNVGLARDHLKRARARLRALDILFEAQSWPDVVSESQEVVELSLKGLLRAHGVEPPRVHDVSDVLNENASRLPETMHSSLPELTAISKRLRLNLELAFDGAENVTPSDFYSREDARSALESARLVVEVVEPHVS